MRNQESEIGFLCATAGLPSSALCHLFERASGSLGGGLLIKGILRARKTPAPVLPGEKDRGTS